MLKKNNFRVVIDTNVFVSALIYPQSTPGKVIHAAYANHRLIFTAATLQELTQVLERKKFNKLILPKEREQLLSGLHLFSDIVPVTKTIRACRDPHDNILLEAAVNGNADFIISGDEDLLMLHPFKGIKIVNPTEFLKHA